MSSEPLYVWESELDAKDKAVKKTGFHPNRERDFKQWISLNQLII